jgi:hypothetical protein
MLLSLKTFSSALSSTRGHFDVLINNALFFISASSTAPTSPFERSDKTGGMYTHDIRLLKQLLLTHDQKRLLAIRLTGKPASLSF